MSTTPTVRPAAKASRVARVCAKPGISLRPAPAEFSRGHAAVSVVWKILPDPARARAAVAAGHEGARLNAALAFLRSRPSPDRPAKGLCRFRV